MNLSGKLKLTSLQGERARETLVLTAVDDCWPKIVSKMKELAAKGQRSCKVIPSAFSDGGDREFEMLVLAAVRMKAEEEGLRMEAAKENIPGILDLKGGGELYGVIHW